MGVLDWSAGGFGGGGAKEEDFKGEGDFGLVFLIFICCWKVGLLGGVWWWW